MIVAVELITDDIDNDSKIEVIHLLNDFFWMDVIQTANIVRNKVAVKEVWHFSDIYFIIVDYLVVRENGRVDYSNVLIVLVSLFLVCLVVLERITVETSGVINVQII